MKSKILADPLSSNSKGSAEGLSKHILTRKQNRSLQLPKDFELETKDSLHFGLCHHDHIERYFNEFCKESKTNTSVIQKIADYTMSPVNKAPLNKTPLGKRGSLNSSLATFARAALQYPPRGPSNLIPIKYSFIIDMISLFTSGRYNFRCWYRS